MSERSERGTFFWFIGVVETRPEEDPKNLGRVQVRVLDYHSPFKKDIKTKNLPWAPIIMPPTSASNSGIGQTPFGLVEGSWVFGFFLDGKYAQQPVVIGSFNGIEPELKDQNSGVDLKAEGGCSVYQKNAGDGFRDGRTEEQRKLHPKIPKNHKFPDGKENEGNDQGASFDDEVQTKYPREQFINCPDVNPIALGNIKKYIDKLYGLKFKSRTKGGIVDDGFCVAEIGMEDFESGIINQEGVSKFNKKFNISPITTTAYKTKIKNYKPFTETPEALNDAAEIIYDKTAIKDGEEIYKTDSYIRNKDLKEIKDEKCK